MDAGQWVCKEEYWVSSCVCKRLKACVCVCNGQVRLNRADVAFEVENVVAIDWELEYRGTANVFKHNGRVVAKPMNS